MDAEKVAKITGHRFEGYTPGMLALEVELFQSGQGASSITEAVESLKAVATALADTDESLRDGLKQVGVAWHSGAAEQAKSIFGGNADFAGDAKSKVNNSAQVAFVLSEAYSTMVNKLPDPETLRAGDGGLGLTDVLGGLIGHETDHAARVKAARAARDQAVDALTEFQQTCGDELNSVDVLDSPQHLLLDDGSGKASGPGGDPSLATSAAAMTEGLAPTPETSAGHVDKQIDAKGSTAAAGAGAGRPRGDYENHGRGTVGPGTVPDEPCEDDAPPSQRSGVDPTAHQDTSPSTSPSGTFPPAGQPSPAIGVVPPTSGYPGSTPGAPGAPGGTPGTPGAPGAVPGAPGFGPGGAGPTPGGVIPPGAAGGGSSSGSGGGAFAGAGGSGSAGGAGGGGAAGGAKGFGGGPGGKLGFGGILGAPGAPEVAEPLAKGKLTGATPPPPVQGGTPPVPPAAAAAAGAGAGAGLASGAAAVAAGAVAGATSGEEDKERRPKGLGKDTDVDGRPLHELEVGEIPDEQSAKTVEKLEPKPSSDAPKYLEQAAVQPGVTDENRVRSQPVDDVDLFADQRMVAPEVIGDDPASAYEANRKDNP